MSRLLGGRKTHATSRSATRNRSTDLSPWPCRQLACLCAHAYTDTNEEPTMTLLSSKIERPPTRTLSGTAWMPAKHCSYLHNTPPPPFNPPPQAPGPQVVVAATCTFFGAGCHNHTHPGARRGGRGGWWGHVAGSFGIYMPNGLAVSLGAGRQPVTSEGLTCCRSRSRTPRAARPRPSPGRTRSYPVRRRPPAGRPTTWRRRSARPGCSGTPACRYRPG
jgi:hypothetical protein